MLNSLMHAPPFSMDSATQKSPINGQGSSGQCPKREKIVSTNETRTEQTGSGWLVVERTRESGRIRYQKHGAPNSRADIVFFSGKTVGAAGHGKRGTPRFHWAFRRGTGDLRENRAGGNVFVTCCEPLAQSCETAERGGSFSAFCDSMMRTCVVLAGRKLTAGGWASFLRVVTLQIFLCASAWAANTPVQQSVMLAWDPSTDPTTVGYCLYYGSASGNYTTRVDLKTNTTVTVTNLTGGQTYYFAATAYNAANVESPPSNEASFVASTNPPPSLNPVNTQYVNALGRLLVTNKATTPNTVGRVYTYTLDPGAPTGMRINPSTGLLSWFAPMSAAGNSYAVTVHVTDNAVPPASTAQTLTVVVNHGLQLSLGPAVVAV